MEPIENKNSEINYTNTTLISADIKAVYKAIILDIDKWWSTTKGKANEIGSEFKIEFGGESYWKFEVVNLIEKKQIVWKCIESNQDHNIQGIDEEWLNSIVTWKLSKNEEGTKVSFLHDGLQPSGVCYDVCSRAWDFYLFDSLKNYLETGKGNPNGM